MEQFSTWLTNHRLAFTRWLQYGRKTKPSSAGTQFLKAELAQDHFIDGYPRQNNVGALFGEANDSRPLAQWH